MEAGRHGRFEGQTRASAPTIKSNAQFLHIVFLAFSDGFCIFADEVTKNQ